MAVAENIQKVEEIITGILGVVTTASGAVPIIAALLGQVPPAVAQAFPPERIQEIIDGYETKEQQYDEKFLPPEGEDGDDGSDA